MGLQSIRCGDVALLFDDADGHVRHLEVGGVEILRGIYAAVRDQNWDTVAPRLSGLAVERQAAGAEIRFTVDTVAPPVDFTWQGFVRLEAEKGRLVYTLRGRARTTFLKNRIGFCVLHPAELRGQPVTVESVEGDLREGTWPGEIAPHQPFRNIRGITHRPSAGLRVTVSLSGDTFEMEDQRNWSDASFKTYCTPLDDPFPAEIGEGAEISQEICVTWSTGAPRGSRGADPAVPGLLLWLPSDAVVRAMPRIGFGASEPNGADDATDRKRLADLKPCHLRVDLRGEGEAMAARLRVACEEARAAGAGLEVAIFGNDDGPARDFATVAEVVARSGVAPDIRRWLVFATKAKTTPAGFVGAAQAALRPVAPEAEFVVGTDAYFAELNRKPPPDEGGDAVSFSLNPQVHAFDDLSLVETLSIQGELVRNAGRIAGRKPVLVSPVTLRPRFNPNATVTEAAEVGSGESPPADPRQHTVMGALWTLGSFASLAGAGVAAITYYQTKGPRGLHPGSGSRADPAEASNHSGEVFPLWWVFRALADFAGGQAGQLHSSHPLRWTGVMLAHKARRRLLVANFTGDALPVRSIPLVSGAAPGRILVSDTSPPGGLVNANCPPRSLVQWDWSEAPMEPRESSPT